MSNDEGEQAIRVIAAHQEAIERRYRKPSDYKTTASADELWSTISTKDLGKKD
jgi:hypothetical protein